MNNRKHCEEIIEVVNKMEKGLLAPINSISEKNLNHVFAENKMTIGQIAVHCGAWAEYFMTNNPSWEPVKWTCKSVSYPLSLENVKMIIKNGFNAIRSKLNFINDDLLEIDEKGEKGKGYIICRLLLHAMTHGNQMAYLRQILEPELKESEISGMFGSMATAYIRLSYFTEIDKRVPGF